MKKINFELIKKIDYVLVFLVAIVGLVSLLVTLFSTISFYVSRNSKTPHIELVDSDDDKSSEKIVESIDFLEKVKDVYVFSVSSSVLKSSDLTSSSIGTESFSNTVKKHSSGSEIVNLIFVKDGQELTLFPSKSFIYKYVFFNCDDYDEYGDFDRMSYMKKSYDYNIYAVIRGDTNGDKKLDSKDDIAFFVSDYDGKNLKEISSSIYHLECVDKNTFLFTEYDNGKVNYYEYDGSNKKLIKSIEKEITVKSIYIY